MWIPLIGTPKNNRRDKFLTNLGFGAFLNAVRGGRVRNSKRVSSKKWGVTDQPVGVPEAVC